MKTIKNKITKGTSAPAKKIWATLGGKKYEFPAKDAYELHDFMQQIGGIQVHTAPETPSSSSESPTSWSSLFSFSTACLPVLCVDDRCYVANQVENNIVHEAVPIDIDKHQRGCNVYGEGKAEIIQLAINMQSFGRIVWEAFTSGKEYPSGYIEFTGRIPYHDLQTGDVVTSDLTYGWDLDRNRSKMYLIRRERQNKSYIVIHEIHGNEILSYDVLSSDETSWSSVWHALHEVINTNGWMEGELRFKRKRKPAKFTLRPQDTKRVTSFVI